MFSVTSRAELIKQPRGGYLKTGLFVKEEYNDGIILNRNENIDPSIAGTVVDYLTRFMSGEKAKDAFKTSIYGAIVLDTYEDSGGEEAEKALCYTNKITGLDDESIINACKLVGYDVCFRNTCENYRADGLVPDEYAISNIRNMVHRSITFFQSEGGIEKTNITFENGYTDIVSSGDADYLTLSGLWDMKVSKHELNAQYTLQILIYYLLGMRSDHGTFSKIRKLGIYNPRKNVCYWTDVSFIPQSVISIVSREVIGYTDV